MARLGLVGLGLFGLLLVAGCSSSSPLQTRCTNGCMRANSLCARTTDCAALCADFGSVPASCTAAWGAAYTCAEALPDATFCMYGTAGGPCWDEVQVTVTCATGVDSGSGVDAGM